MHGNRIQIQNLAASIVCLISGRPYMRMPRCVWKFHFPRRTVYLDISVCPLQQLISFCPDHRGFSKSYPSLFYKRERSSRSSQKSKLLPEQTPPRKTRMSDKTLNEQVEMLECVLITPTPLLLDLINSNKTIQACIIFTNAHA